MLFKISPSAHSSAQTFIIFLVFLLQQILSLRWISSTICCLCQGHQPKWPIRGLEIISYTRIHTQIHKHTQNRHTVRPCKNWIVFSHEWSVTIYMSSVSHNTALGQPPFYWAPLYVFLFCSNQSVKTWLHSMLI